MRKHVGTGREAVKDALTSEDFLGKDVIDSTGSFIGVTDNIYLDREMFAMVAISVDPGFLRKGLLIGRDHVHEVTETAVHLKIQPAPQLRGMKVYDKNGAEIGTVKRVHIVEGSNDIDTIVVRRGLFRRKLHVPGNLIDSSTERVRLKATHEELRKK